MQVKVWFRIGTQRYKQVKDVCPFWSKLRCRSWTMWGVDLTVDFLVSSPFYATIPGPFCSPFDVTPHHNWPTYSPDGFLIMAFEIGVVAIILCYTSSIKTGLVYFYSGGYLSWYYTPLLVFSNRQGCCSVILLLSRYVSFTIVLLLSIGQYFT